MKFDLPIICLIGSAFVLCLLGEAALLVRRYRKRREVLPAPQPDDRNKLDEWWRIMEREET